MVKHKILIADDDESIMDMIQKALEIDGYEVTAVSNGKEAVKKEDKVRPDLIILDVEMPVMDGFEACRIIREKRKDLNYIPIIFLSGLSDKGNVMTGLKAGADDYLLKPFEAHELSLRVSNLLKIRDLISRVESLENVIFSLVKSIEARDSYTAGHTRRVASISANIAREIGLSNEDVETIRRASLLHDIGKLGIPDEILNKKGKLTDKEFDKIKEHPVLGHEICSNLRLVPHAIDIIRHHHEKIDGGGYPDKLKGDQIDKFVRIVTVADIFDALTTNRPYRPAKSNQEAFDILKDESERGKIDTSIVNCLENLIKENNN